MLMPSPLPRLAPVALPAWGGQRECPELLSLHGPEERMGHPNTPRMGGGVQTTKKSFYTKHRLIHPS